jgi:hypothetical protein
MGGVGKRIITKTWMSEYFLQGPILRAGGDATWRLEALSVGTPKLGACLQVGK